jgi:hypothetical protein
MLLELDDSDPLVRQETAKMCSAGGNGPVFGSWLRLQWSLAKKTARICKTVIDPGDQATDGSIRLSTQECKTLLQEYRGASVAKRALVLLPLADGVVESRHRSSDLC